MVNLGLKANDSIFYTNQYYQSGGSLLSCTIPASSVILSSGNIFDSSIFFQELLINGGHTNSSFTYEAWPGATGIGKVHISGQFPTVTKSVEGLPDVIMRGTVPTFGDRFYLQCSGVQLSGPINLNGTIETDYLQAEYLGLNSSGTVVTNICETFDIFNTGTMNINVLKIKHITNSGTLLVESLSGVSSVSLINYDKFTCNETGIIYLALINSGIVNMPIAKTGIIVRTFLSNNLPRTGINFQVLSAPNALLSLNTIVNNVSGNIIATGIELGLNSQNYGNIDSTQDIYVLQDSVNQPSGLLKAINNVIIKNQAINYGNIKANQIQFLDQSINFANIEPSKNPIIFYNTSINSGNLFSATLKDNSINYGSIKQAIFDDHSINLADIIMSGNNEKIVFTGLSVNAGNITNRGSYNNLLFAGYGDLRQTIINDINWGSAFAVPTNSGFVGGATFKDRTINHGWTIDCHFRDESVNVSGYSWSPSFFNKAINRATAVVSGQFYNTSINEGYVTSGIFYDNSRNLGSGEALSFYGTSQNLNLSTVAYFYPNSINHWDGGRVTQSIFYNSVNSGICTVNPGRGWDILREKSTFIGLNARNMGQCIDGQFYFLEGAKNGNFISGFLTLNHNNSLPLIAHATGIYFNNGTNYGLIVGAEKCSFESGSSNYGMISQCGQVIFHNNSTNNMGLKFYDPWRYSVYRDTTDRWSSRDFGYGMIKDVNTVIFSGNSINDGLVGACYSGLFIDNSINNQPLSISELSFFNNSQNNSLISVNSVVFSGYGVNKAEIRAYSNISFIAGSVNESPIISGFGIMYSGYSTNNGISGVANQINFDNSFNNQTLRAFGDVTFKTYSYNNGQLVANSRYYLAVPQGSSTLTKYRLNTITFDNSINNNTIISGIVYFNNYSINSGTIIGEAIFDSTSVNSGTIIPVDLIFEGVF